MEIQFLLDGGKIMKIKIVNTGWTGDGRVYICGEVYSTPKLPKDLMEFVLGDRKGIIRNKKYATLIDDVTFDCPKCNFIAKSKASLSIHLYRAHKQKARKKEK
jgi:hypothetical protein